MNGDQRPYTAQSLNNLSAGSKRAGAVYGGNNAKNLAAFSGSHYGNGVGSKTHTGGFNFNNSIGKATGPHKYSHSHQGDDMIFVLMYVKLQRLYIAWACYTRTFLGDPFRLNNMWCVL